MKHLLKKVWKESVYRNSLYLIINSFIMALFGFIFWTIAAKHFSSEDVGLAIAVISAVSLIGSISLLGLNTSILKFKNKSLNFTALLFGTSTAALLSIVFLLFVQVFSPNLSFLSAEWLSLLGFILFCVLSVIYSLINSMLIAEGRSFIVLLKDTIFSLVKVMIVFFVSGFFGLLLSWYIGILCAILLSVYFITLENKLFDVRQVFQFSFYNYLSNIFSILPHVLLPLLIVHYMGASSAAYFYIVWMIASLLFIIPQSMAQNLLSSGDGKKLGHAYIFSLVLLLVGIAGVFIFGELFLSFFHQEYLVALPLLYILALSSLPYAVRKIYQTKLNIEGKVRPTMLIDLITVVVTLGGSILFIDYGFLAVGISWSVGNIVGFVGVFWK